ncbi:heme lyase CcmF/NrfE family subunit [candidate division KSB3 bacterium]|uniref:Heme lyase CcmF/NrfE family subunit n=1 Tax=candidate division KSB3 bacterium TaxID=2044937 RepID=A0A9D5JSU7_9BACT|nr:heme lyase CcmF/NrfE family subunit [candidate division KSB3 bacterium]MBD3323570.1 heme lyase CcmF/NrfE family subunit [candidate division KSB3 bacterium]
MAYIGYIALLAALAGTIYVVIASVLRLKSPTRDRELYTEEALWGIAGLFTLAILSLLYLLLRRDFQIAYVASYTDLTLPTEYIISALWAGQEGSLLFWGWLLSLCSIVFLWYYKATKEEVPYLHMVLALTLGFFLVLTIFLANPFERLSFTPPDGNGMNPLLQNLYMAIHPPVLFVGYAGFVVPFALAFAALCTGTLRDAWLTHLRGWLLFSWYFLGIGILLGAHWAYLELGWGGYWSWDPVENASLIPWLSATALIHTLIVQQKRGLLTIWNMFLGILTFLLCILATFITRSGMIESVHAFGESKIGYYFLTFLFVVSLCALGLIISRWNTWGSTYELRSLLSKEGNILVTNYVFMGLGFAVLYGTLYPFFSELFTGKKVVVNTSFFNRVSIPVGLLLLLIMGICQLIAWRKASLTNLRRRFLLPLEITVVGVILLAMLGMRHLPVLLTCGLGGFVVVTMGVDVVKSLLRSRRVLQTSSAEIVARLFFAHKQRYSGYIFHLGVVLMFMGIAVSSTYKLEQEVSLRPGESSTLGDIRFHYERLGVQEDIHKAAVFAEVSLYEEEKNFDTVLPQKRFYGEPPDWQTTTEIGLHTSLAKDVYVILAGWQEDETAVFNVMINPLIIWIWIGGFVVFTIGIVFVTIPKAWAARRILKRKTPPTR